MPAAAAAPLLEGLLGGLGGAEAAGGAAAAEGGGSGLLSKFGGGALQSGAMHMTKPHVMARAIQPGGPHPLTAASDNFSNLQPRQFG